MLNSGVGQPLLEKTNRKVPQDPLLLSRKQVFEFIRRFDNQAVFEQDHSKRKLTQIVLRALLKGSFEEVNGLWHVTSGRNLGGLDEVEIRVVAHGLRRLSVRYDSQLHAHGVEGFNQHLEIEFVFVSSLSLQAAVEDPVAYDWVFITALFIQACIPMHIGHRRFWFFCRVNKLNP